MIRILGFEGLLGDAVITYGAAAIEAPSGIVLNSFTRHRQAIEDLDESEALTRFRTPWDVEGDDLQEESLVVVAIRRDGVPAYVTDLLPDTGRLRGYIKSKREKPYIYFLLRNRDAFRVYTEETAQACAESVMGESWTGGDAVGLIRCALILTPRDPTLLALRVHLSRDASMARRTADLLLESTSETERQIFHAILVACERSADPKTLYMVKYEDGEQRWGGFDLDDAVTTFQSIDSLHDKLEPSIRKKLPFLGEGERLPRDRLQHFAAGSAEIGFGVRGKNLRERVLRYFSLEALARLLRGEIPTELAHDAAFIQDLRKIIAPEGGATLKHQPIGTEEMEPVVVEIPEEDDRLVDETQFRALGFVQGFYREVKRAEIRFSPMHVEAVSISDDGSGLNPIGAEVLRDATGLFRPALFALLRRTLVSGRVHWFLQRMTLLGQAPEKFDTFGSTLVPKALFATGDELEATYQNDLISAGGSHARVYGRNIEACKEWMSAWSQETRERELLAGASDESRWFPPSRFLDGLRLNATMRILLVLGPAPEGAAIDQLVEMINDRFQTYVRRNNTWRTVRQNTDLFLEHDDDIRLTPLGSRWFNVLQRYVWAFNSGQ